MAAPLGKQSCFIAVTLITLLSTQSSATSTELVAETGIRESDVRKTMNVLCERGWFSKAPNRKTVVYTWGTCRREQVISVVDANVSVFCRIELFSAEADILKVMFELVDAQEEFVFTELIDATGCGIGSGRLLIYKLLRCGWLNIVRKAQKNRAGWFTHTYTIPLERRESIKTLLQAAGYEQFGI